MEAEPVGSPESHLIILEQVGCGCVSGHFCEWPQLKPACKWAVEEIERLKKETKCLEQK